MQGKAQKSRREDKKSPINNILISTIIGSILYFGFLAVFALCALNSDFNASTYMPVGIIIGFLTATIGGFMAVKPLKQKGALYGAITGLAQALVCSVALFAVNKGVAGTGIFILIAATVAGGIAGGITAVNLKIKKKY